ncbi:hypothetical protein [Streptomyces sp. NPDC090021]|uniref:hypothetical protein n=1 Tax=Streptomyces sp. NPDC090021 TaxID=3365919 RepID=UPI00383039AC
MCAYALLNQIFGFVEPMNDTGNAGPTSGPAAWALWASYASLIARVLAPRVVSYTPRLQGVKTRDAVA